MVITVSIERALCETFAAVRAQIWREREGGGGAGKNMMDIPSTQLAVLGSSMDPPGGLGT